MRIKTNEKYASIVLKNMYENVSEDIKLSAVLSRIYEEKVSLEIVNNKLNNQINSMELSIIRINPKFNEKSKNYQKMRDEMLETLNSYESVLKQFCNTYDSQIEELILEKAKLEYDLLIKKILQCKIKQKEQLQVERRSIIKGINTVMKTIKGKIVKKEQIKTSVNQMQEEKDITKKPINISSEYLEKQKEIKKQQKRVANIDKKIQKLSEKKKNRLFEALEVGGKTLSTEIKKPRTFKNITKFFSNRFNTYNVIVKNVIEPLRQRIDEFKINELKNITGQKKEFDLAQFHNKLDKNLDKDYMINDNNNSDKRYK